MSESNPGTIILVSLAMNQARFYHLLGRALKRHDWRVVHIAFHEGSHDWLTAQGDLSFNPFRQGKGEVDLAAYPEVDVDALLRHEQAAYEISDVSSLARKLRRHLWSVGHIFDALDARLEGPYFVVQELGGFLSVLSAFFEAKRRCWPNYFIEPSFFRGRVFLTCDSLSAPRVPGPKAPEVSPEVAAYLADAMATQSIVVPVKDRLHYRRPVAKLLDPRNLKRLLAKVLDKYIFRKQEEFQHIGGHISRHARMYFSHRRLRSQYQDLPTAAYVYFPFHVPADMALTIRSPRYLDQIDLVGKLARSIPPGMRVVCKEHPALVGALPASEMITMLTAHRNVVLLSPSINNYTVLRSARAVVTINSKSGAEALLLGKPVVVLGDAFYRDCDLVHRLDDPDELAATLKRVVDAENVPVANDAARYFQDVWDHSLPGELYDLTPENIERFCASVDRRLRH